MGLLSRLLMRFFPAKREDRTEDALDHGTMLAEHLKRQLLVDRPDVGFKYEVDAFSSGNFMLDIRLDLNGERRFIVIDYSLQRDIDGKDPYGCNDCTDDDDCGYGEGCQFSYSTHLQVEVWLRRHVRWLMPTQ